MNSNPEAGHFNHVNLKVVLPNFKRFIHFPTRDNNILDQVYCNISGAYKAAAAPHLGSSAHICDELIPDPWSVGQNQPPKQFRYGLKRLPQHCRTVLKSLTGKCLKMTQNWRPTHSPSWPMCGSECRLYYPQSLSRSTMVSKPETIVWQNSGVYARSSGRSLQVRWQAGLQQGLDRTEEGHPEGQKQVQTAQMALCWQQPTWNSTPFCHSTAVFKWRNVLHIFATLVAVQAFLPTVKSPVCESGL